MEMTPILKTANLTYCFPCEERPVWENLNLSFYPGELVLLTGDCGSGKSTLLKCLCGVIPHLMRGSLTGEITLAGKNLAFIKPGEIIRHIGVVWQNVEAQILHQQAADELVFGMENLGLPPTEMLDRLREILLLVRLEENTPVTSLSGGQKQRLVIGASLIMQPSILLLDEPLANLDMPAVKRLLSFLRELTRNKTTIIMAEHRLDLAAAYADRTLLLENGRITEKTVSPEDSAPQATSIQPDHCPAAAPPQAPPPLSSPPARSGFAKPLLQVQNLCVAYGKTEVLKNFSLEAPPGSSIVLLGDNGSGKSTLLKTLCGIKDKTTVNFDTLEICGRRIKKFPARLAGETGLVMQNPNHQLFMSTVRGEISFANEDSGAVAEILSLFELQALADRHPFSLSQGQKRLLALAASLAHRPPLLLLDEPTIGQDRKSLLKMLSVLKTLRETWQTTIITATHDRLAAAELGETIILIQKGEPPITGGPSLADEYFG